MQTVKFQCAKCANQMQVSTEFLGKQVRCPHCKQVVQAPASTPAPAGVASAPVPPGPAPAAPMPPAPGAANEPLFRLPSRRDDEGSIFEANEEGDDLFDNEPKSPKVELPPPPAWPNPNTPAAPAAPGAALPPGNFPNMQLGHPGEAPTVSIPGSVPHVPQLNGDETMPLTTDIQAQAHVAEQAGGEVEPTAARRLAQQRAHQDSMFTYYLLAFLIPYAILMTIICAYFILKPSRPAHPLELLPDFPNDRGGGGGAFKRVEDSKPLPDHMRVKIKDTIQVGDLAVTPLKVEQRRVTYAYENGVHPDQDSPADAIVVTLEVTNTSKDVMFGPNDLFYNRKCTTPTAPDRPYTSLEVGKNRFFGGPCKYVPKAANRPGWREKDPREFIRGSEYNTDLMPGKKLTMIVCTDPENTDVVQLVDAHNGPMIYRIQLRRGLLKVGDREGTVTTVIGVEFNKNEILKN